MATTESTREADAPSEESAEGTSQLEGGSYDVIRKRLFDQAAELGKRANRLNEKRTDVFGGSKLHLLETERVRTENNCVPRDIKPIGGQLLFGYNVFIGLKSETTINDVFSLHTFAPKDDGFDLSAVEVSDGHFLADPQFVKEFQDLYKYARDARLIQLRTTESRLLAIFSTDAEITTKKVFRWRIDKDASVKFMDTRGEEDLVEPRSHSFEWQRATREHQVSGRFPHISIFDEVFVETTGGDLTIKIENNTEEGKGIYSEPVEDKNQSLDDAEIHFARVGTLILLKIKPYREDKFRYLIFNTRLQTVLRNDTIGSSCLELPEDQGIIFPGGYYLRTGEFKVFETDIEGLAFKRTVKSPNGEDVLYIFHRQHDGHYLLLPYNLIRKEVANPIHCHGYSVFDDGKMVVFRSLSDEPTRMHPMQVWQTPFFTQEFAASAPTDGSYLAKVGNADLVRGISEALTLRSLATTDQPTRQTYEDVISTATRMDTAYYWIGHEEALNLKETIAELKATAELIIDEFDKVNAIKRRAADALDQAMVDQERLISGLRPQDMKVIEDFMRSLTQLRHQRGHLITLREMRFMNLERVDELEKQVVEAFDHMSQGCVDFLLGETALKPLVERVTNLVGEVEETKKTSELNEHARLLDETNEGLNVLSDVVAGLEVDDPTKRTEILEGISEVYSQVNRARATLQGKKKELASAEGKAEFHAQFQLFGQTVSSAIALADTPEKCDEQLSRLLLNLEELEGRFGEFDEYLGDLAEKREEVTDALQSKRQTLLDERQRRAANVLGAAERIVAGVGRRARTLASADELNAYFASDAMVLKCRDLAKQLIDLGDAVKADEIESKLKSAKQDAVRALRDRLDLYEDGANVVKLGKHRFNVTTQALELTIVPREDSDGELRLYLHLTGTDFYDLLKDEELERARDLWDQQLVSEDKTVYRGEFLAASMLFDAEKGAAGPDLTIDKLNHAAVSSGGLLESVRKYAADRHDEGYERGVHDSDAALILEKVISLRTTSGLLRFAATPRAYACLFWANLAQERRDIIHRRAQSLGRLRAQLESNAAQNALADELSSQILDYVRQMRLDPAEHDGDIAARYLVEELAAEHPRFVASAAAGDLRDALMREVDGRNARRELEDDLRLMEHHPAEQLGLALAWLQALVGRHDDIKKLDHAVLEAAVLIVTEGKLDRETSTGATETLVEGLLGQHSRISERKMPLRLEEFLGRLDNFISNRAPRFRGYRQLRHEVIEREKRALRLEEFQPRVLSSFVRNKLIDDVYLPIIGDNLAKQMGAAGDAKRTDLMGLLMLISPPGYGKTTLMEYVANTLGLIFMKINGPSLGHEVTSLDPEEAPNATARQEVDKLNLALEMGNNVMIYCDDIQHTSPEFLQKFISLCDAQRRIEGVWRGRTRTYDLRGKKVCVVMAGNPYTETGEKFQIPDMLANRADTYNLGDILEGKDAAFALSYIENSLTSNTALAPVAGREPEDKYKLIQMAQGEQVAISELKYAYSNAEVAEITSILERMFIVQKVVLAVNMQYILSASQDDAFRTEPPFKLQGSYRNMNKLAEKIVAAHTPEEIESLLDDHYNGEAQTLTTGAEANLLKLAEMRGRLSKEQQKRWNEIKAGYVRVKVSGNNEDDPVARVTGTLGALAEQLDGIQRAIGYASEQAQERSQSDVGALSAQLAQLTSAVGAAAEQSVTGAQSGSASLSSQVKELTSAIEATAARSQQSSTAVVEALGARLDALATSVQGAAERMAAQAAATKDASQAQGAALAQEVKALAGVVTKAAGATNKAAETNASALSQSMGSMAATVGGVAEALREAAAQAASSTNESGEALNKRLEGIHGTLHAALEQARASSSKDLDALGKQLDSINHTLSVAITDSRKRAEAEAERFAKELAFDEQREKAETARFAEQQRLEQARREAEKKEQPLAPLLAKIEEAVAALSQPKLEVKVERDPAVAELLASQIAMVEETMLPVVQAVAQSLEAAQGLSQQAITQATQAAVAAQENAATARDTATSQQGVRSAEAEALQAKMEELLEAQRQAVEQVKAVVAQAAEQAATAAAHEATQAAELATVQKQMEATAQALAQQVADSQAQTRQAMEVLAQQTSYAHQIAQSQHAAVQEQRQAAAIAQQAASEAQKAAQAKQKMLAEAQARASQAPPSHHAAAPVAYQTASGHPASGAFVQRPGASAEENAAIARAQLAAQRASQSHQQTAEMAQAVHRVEHRVHELTQLMRSLQDRLATAAQSGGGQPPRYDAAIDLHSSSNFYSSGGNVTKDGGIFVQTHRPLPKRGSTVALRVSLPGGVEFDSLAVVEWVRDTRTARSKPGFGARLVDPQPSALRLIDQFVKSRSPLNVDTSAPG